jgi:hypothetical protein
MENLQNNKSIISGPVAFENLLDKCEKREKENLEISSILGSNKIMLAACIELRRKISLKHGTFPRMPFQSGFPLSDGKLDTDVGSSDPILF